MVVRKRERKVEIFFFCSISSPRSVVLENEDNIYEQQGLVANLSNFSISNVTLCTLYVSVSVVVPNS